MSKIPPCLPQLTACWMGNYVLPVNLPSAKQALFFWKESLTPAIPDFFQILTQDGLF